MKHLFVIAFLHSFFLSARCQANIESSINRIENGLTQDLVSYDTASIRKMNILDRMKYYKVNGVSIAVIEDGKIAWTKAYGESDGSTGEMATTETLFQAASISKVITALAALTLVKGGKIALDENVNNKLTSWKVEENEFTRNEKVTLRRLLCHSAGFTDDYGFAGYKSADSIPTLSDILNGQSPANNRKALTVNYVPGTSSRYSGGGYLIIQQLVEDITGIPFTKYVQNTIFDKLDLHHSTYNFHPDNNNTFKIARGHDAEGKVDAKDKYYIYPESAAAGWWCTPGDLASLLIEMQKEYQGISNKILNGALLDSMLTPQSQNDDRGLGVYLTGAERVKGFWHAGQNAGYNSLFYAGTGNGQGAVVMLNSDAAIELAEEVIRSIANENHWSFMQTKLVTKQSGDSLKAMIGTYTSKEGLTVKITKKEDDLFIQFREPNSSRLSPPLHFYHTKEGRYIITEAPDLVYYTVSTGNNHNEMILHKNGGTQMVLAKIK